MKKILVIVDMQNDFITGPLGSKEAVAVVDKVSGKIRNFDGSIFATLDTHKEDYLKTQEGKMLPIKHCIQYSDGWMLNAVIAEALDKKTFAPVQKPTFGSVDLVQKLDLQRLVYQDIEIELIGVCTDICVVSNALLLKAHFPESPISVDASCCAGTTPEAHKAALTVMKSCQIEVINEDK